MTLDEILGNKELGDDQEIKLGEQTFKLGDLRGIASERESLRTERETIAKERDEFRGKFDTVSQAAAKLLEQAGAAAERESHEPPPKSPRDTLREALSPLLQEEDPQLKALMEDKVFGKALSTVEERAYNRAKKELEAIDAKYSELKTEMAKGFEGMTVAQLSERLERWYAINRNDIPKGADKKPLSMQQIHDYAVQRNFVKPGTRLLDYDAALDALAEPTRIEARMKDIREKAFQEGMEAGRTQAGKVIPIFGDRSAGGVAPEKVNTTGMSARQIMEGQLQRGLADLSRAENE